jgi:hypothetical protein
VATDDWTLKVWRLHPQGVRITSAERTLQGTANRDAARWCGPFTHANKAGWWVHSPVDIDITWHGGSDFEYELHTPYSPADGHLIHFLVDEERGACPHQWLSDPNGGRTKFTWGEVEHGVVQIWTGCMFETPPGWGLHLRSPINMGDRSIHVMEAMLETDWLQYDIWLNIAFNRVGEKVELRRDSGPPLAQFVPVRRESYDTRWAVEEELVNRDSPEAERAFDFFVDYNEKKFASGGKQMRSEGLTKDSTTYYRERRRCRAAEQR